MTTATVSIYEHGPFNGQSQSSWVNPGANDIIDVSRALSIKTSFSEQEETDQRNTVTLAGDREPPRPARF